MRDGGIELINRRFNIRTFRSELTEEEYEEAKRETQEQLAIFHDTLNNISSGSTTLIDELSAMKMMIKTAISEAFKTPEVIRLLADKQPAKLRYRLELLERDNKAGSLSFSQYLLSKREILTALRDLGDTLSPEETELLANDGSELRDSLQPVITDGHLSSEQIFVCGEEIPRMLSEWYLAVEKIRAIATN
ncbi:unnamed protein product [Soboliphyme baturini]|uniref:Protein LZIC n=1 Tax=Soboliphyme baturini TaxID=241478 RepID=A0A183ID72_9BILA|nr:unnamed protein product [Soboliphyme baturini]